MRNLFFDIIQIAEALETIADKPGVQEHSFRIISWCYRPIILEEYIAYLLSGDLFSSLGVEYQK